MDPLTHALLGGAAAAAVARSDELRPAAAIGAVAALLPDLDVLVDPASDPLLALEVHRAYTHAIPLVPLLALVAVALTWKIGTLSFGRRWALASLGALSHPLLDACTSYGVRLWWPLGGSWTAGCLVAVVDPLPTLALGVLLGLAVRRRAPRLARAALVVLLCYLALGGVQQWRARRALAAHPARGPIADAVVKPTLGNLLLWRVVSRNGPTIRADAVWVGHEARVTIGDVAWRVRPTAGDGARFDRITRGWTIAHPAEPGVLGDARYAMLPDELIPLWGVELGPGGSRWRNFRRRDRATRQRFAELLLGR